MLTTSVRLYVSLKPTRMILLILLHIAESSKALSLLSNKKFQNNSLDWLLKLIKEID